MLTDGFPLIYNLTYRIVDVFILFMHATKLLSILNHRYLFQFFYQFLFIYFERLTCHLKIEYMILTGHQ